MPEAKKQQLPTHTQCKFFHSFGMIFEKRQKNNNLPLKTMKPPYLEQLQNISLASRSKADWRGEMEEKDNFVLLSARHKRRL